MRASSTCQRCLIHLRSAAISHRPATHKSSTQLLHRTQQWCSAPTVFRSQRRSVTTMLRDEKGAPPPPSEIAQKNIPPALPKYPNATPDIDSSRVLLKPNNLFHTMDRSPVPAMRERAKNIKKHAYCTHPEHAATRDYKHVKFTCPDCGVPTYCSEKHWLDDYENHLLICETLKEANEDDHDLHSGRFFPEFEYPEGQIEEQLINFTNWDTFFYTRNFNAINANRQMRQVTKLLTYPTTIASVLHELSPYSLKERLTNEGLRSLSALRYTLHPPLTGAGQGVKNIRTTPPPIRLFILGARAESSLPRDVWYQLCYIFPRASFHLVFVGPESMQGRESEYPLPDRTPGNPFGAVLERVDYHMKISTFVEYFHTLHEAGTFEPYDPYFDCFVLFHPGLGHPGSAPEWEHTLPKLLETKLPILCTGYTKSDLSRDVEWVKDKCKDEFDILMHPGENRFKSLKWDINDADPTDLSQGNWGSWAFRGKRYETTKKHAEESTQ